MPLDHGMPVQPVPEEAKGDWPGQTLFIHADELMRRLGDGRARLCTDERHRMLREQVRFEVRLGRDVRVTDLPGQRNTHLRSVRWLPVIVADVVPAWGLWDVLGFFRDHAMVPYETAAARNAALAETMTKLARMPWTGP